MTRRELPAYLNTALVSAALACFFLPDFLLIYAPGIDMSLVWAFNHFAATGFTGANIIAFPHGPLAFMMYPLMTAHNLGATVAIYLISAAGCGVSLRHLMLTNETYSHFRFLAVYLLILAVADIQLLLVALTALLCGIHLSSRALWTLAIAAAVTVVNALIKTYGGAVSVSLFAATAVYTAVRDRKIHTAAYALGSITACFLIIWLLLFRSVDGAADFIRAQAELALGNSDSVQYAQHNNWLLLTGYVAALVAIYRFTTGAARGMTIVLLLPLFAGWKHGMARGESVHMSGQLSLTILLLAVVYAMTENQRMRMLAAGITGCLLFYLNIPEGAPLLERLHPVRSIGNLYDYTFRYDSLKDDAEAHIKYYVRGQQLPDTILRAVEGESIDIYPWNYAIAATNPVIWQPRPVLNSYAAYTRWLDERDSLHFAGVHAPMHVLWEFTDPDEKGYHLESIDYRYLLDDEPGALLSFFSNYALVQKHARYLLYRKRDVPLRVESDQQPEIKLHLNEWMDVPSVNADEILRLKLQCRRTLPGSVKSALYKGEIFYIYYQLRNGQVLCHRFAPANAKRGLWINPLVLHPQVDGRETLVTRVMVACDDARFVQDDVTAAFETVRFEGGHAASTVFGKDSTTYHPLFFHSSSGTVSGEALTQPDVHRVDPRKHLQVTELPEVPDTVDAVNIVLRFEGFIKLHRGSKGYFCITSGNQPSTKAEYIRQFDDVAAHSELWTHFYLTAVVPADNASIIGDLRCFVVNEGEEPLMLDDITVSAEARGY